MASIMAQVATIDGAGRLVVPKPVRERLRLVAGTRLHITEEDDRLVLSPERPEPRLVEQDGYLVIDLGIDGAVDIRPGDVRDERLRRPVEFALLR